jgi:Domain of unknown function (DUF4864)
MGRLATACIAAAVCLAAVSLGPTLQAEEPQRPAAEAQAGILATIQGQLDAFQRDDWSRAFSYATPKLRQLFGTPENFMAMVLGGYRSVYRPQSVEFLEARIIPGESGNRTGQAVRFVGPDGKAVIAVYTMAQQPDGSWRIAAVRLIQTGEISS